MPQIRWVWKFLIVIFFIFANGCSCERKSETAKNDPTKLNVVLICIDNLRADHMSLYGYHRKTTPFLDKWASNGHVFENFYSSTHMTVPSEGSVFTGRYPFENGLISYEHRFWPQIETITSVLSKRGYKSLAYGNSWEYRAFPTAEESFRPLFDQYEIVHRMENNRVLKVKPISSFLDNIGTNNFIIWLPLGTIHSPYGYPFKNSYSDKNYNGPLKPFEKFPGSNFWVYKNTLYPITAETNFNFSKFNKNMVTESFSQKVALKKEDTDWLIDRYDDGIIEFDRQLETIINLFEQKDLMKNTIFVLYSNHGEELNEHGYFGHFDIYQGNIHNPLVIKSPTLAGSKRHKILSSGVDLLPTLFSMLKIDSPPEMDGLNLFSAEAEARKNIYVVRTPFWESLLRVKNRSSIWDDFRDKISTEDYMEPVIITDRYKLIHRRGRFISKKYNAIQFVTKINFNFPEYEMYDLLKDPKEQNNIASKSKDFEPLLKQLNKFEKRIESKKNKFKKANTKIQDYQ